MHKNNNKCDGMVANVLVIYSIGVRLNPMFFFFLTFESHVKYFTNLNNIYVCIKPYQAYASLTSLAELP